MLRVIAIGIVVLLAVVGGAAVFGYYRADASFGLSESPVVGYEELLDTNVRGAVVLQPAKGLAFVKEMLPEGSSALPSWLPWNVAELLDMGMVREAALLLGTNAAEEKVTFTLFANEKMGGPVIASEGSQQAFFKQGGPFKWTDPPLELPRRGLLRGNAWVPMPATVTGAVAQYWQPAQSEVKINISRNHLAEGYLDNSDGALLAIAGAMSEANGGSTEQLMADQNARDIITTIGALRVAADITGPDTLTIQLAITPAINSTEENQKKIPFVVNFLAFPYIKDQLQKNYDLKLDWVENKKTALTDGIITAEATLTGFRTRIQSQLYQAFGEVPPISGEKELQGEPVPVP